MITPTDNSIKTKLYNKTKTKTNNNMWGAVIGAAVSAVAAIASAASNRKFQKKTMREQNEFNANEAQVTREWNQQMDNTKYQRQVADMQAAGINPALAMNGGVTTQATSNATASSGSGIPGGLDLSSVMEMALQMSQFKLQSKQLKLQEKLIDSQANKNNADAAKTKKETSWIDELNSANIDQIRANINQVWSNISVNDSTIDLNGHKISMYDAQTGLFNSQMNTEEKKAQLLESQKVINDLTKQKMQILMPYVEKYQKSIIALNEANTEKAYQDAYAAYASASNSLAQAALNEEIVSSDYYKKMGGKIDAETGMIVESTKLTTQKIKTEEWTTLYTKRSYKWQGVNNAIDNTCKVVNTACNAYATFATGGLAGAASGGISSGYDYLGMPGID